MTSNVNEIADLLKKALAKLDDQRARDEGGISTTAPPLSERPRAPRYPFREDAGTVFRSKPGYDWTCPYCLKAILDGDMVVAFEPKPGSRTTYAHHHCDMLEQEYLDALDRD